MPNDYKFFEDTLSGKQKEIYDIAPVINSVGDFQTLSGINVVINSIRNLLLTPLGFYPFDPEYGSLLYKKLFEPSDTITKEEIVYEVTQRVKRYDDRVKIDRVEVSYTVDRKTAVVDVYINRDGVVGKVSNILNSQQTMFGLEDNITAAWNS